MRRKAVATEALWLLGCYGVSFLLLGYLIGYRIFLCNPLDIQMHNTYFVLTNTLATLPLFLVVAFVVTSARAIAKPLRTRYTWMVVLLLSMLLLLSIVLIVLISKKVIR